MSEGREGVLPGLKNWPPKPITEHGQPKPEDDPINQAPEPGQVQGYRRVDGPSDEEVAEKKKKMREESPWSNPNREGGTQAGGGGEGSAA
ncbi:g10306 [Coccomyxa elongata]